MSVVRPASYAPPAYAPSRSEPGDDAPAAPAPPAATPRALRAANRFASLLFAGATAVQAYDYLSLTFDTSMRVDLTRLGVVAVIALALTVVWERRGPRASDQRLLDGLHRWIRLFFAFELFWYALPKLLPDGQLPTPSMLQADDPFYAIRPNALVGAWAGHSALMNAGFALTELLCAALLLFDRTARLGLCLFVAIIGNLLLINVGYPSLTMLPSSIFWLVVALLLLANDRDWVRASFLARDAAPVRLRTWTPRSRLEWALMAALAVAAVANQRYMWVKYYTPAFAVRSQLRGVWAVDSAGGTPRDPAWTRVVFDDAGVGRVRTAGGARAMGYTVDTVARRVTLTFDDAPGAPWEARYELTAAPERLVLVTADSARAVLRPLYRGLPVDRGLLIRR
jgi:hypothetical protein